MKYIKYIQKNIYYIVKNSFFYNYYVNSKNLIKNKQLILLYA